MLYADANADLGPLPNFWNHIHFHPTDAIEDPWGQRILNRVKEDGVASTVRMYAMLEDIVTMDDQGRLQYDFSENDKRMDYMVEKGFCLFLCYAYMPPCLAAHPESLHAAAKNKTRYKGKMIIASEPRDYGLWEEICREYTRHIVDRYGEDRVASWKLQCLNEPDLPPYFMGYLDRSPASDALRLREYEKLYRGFVRGIRAVSPRLKVGGPSFAYSQPLLEAFLQGLRADGTPIDFISIHTYGTNVKKLNSGERLLHAENTLVLHRQWQAIIDRYYPDLPIIVDEWGASAQGFWNREECPALMFREGSEYAAYMGKMIALYVREQVRVDKMLICLSGQHEMTVDFSGFRGFFTLNFIPKPIYNAFALLHRMGDRLLKSGGDGGDLCVLASGREDGSLAVMLAYAAPHFDRLLPDLTQQLRLEGLGGVRRVTLWRIDETHCNSYKYALRKGWGDGTYTPAQIGELKAEAQLRPWRVFTQDFNANATLSVEMATNALVLVEIGAENHEI